MIDCSAVFREWEQHSAVTDAHAPKRRHALDHQSAARRDHLWHTRQERTGERVSGAKSDRQVHSDHDEMRKLDRPFHRDQHAIRPILSSHPGVDLFAAWKAPAVRYLRPIAQHPPDQPTLFFHPPVPPYLASFAVAQAVR